MPKDTRIDGETPNVSRAQLTDPHSRRELLRRAGAIGVSLPVAGALQATRGEMTHAASASAQEGGGGQAVIRFVDEPDTLFAPAAQAARASWILSFIANGLTTLRQPDMEVVPDLAEAWEVSDDGLIYTFTLHQGVQWQDGEPFGPEDVTFTFELIAHPEYPGVLVPSLAVIEGAQAYKDGEAEEISGLLVLDETQVQFTLTEPSALFLATAAIQKILPRHILADAAPAEVDRHPFARQPIYTGPFMVETWTPDESLTFTAFTDSFVGRPKLDSLVIRVIPDPASAIAEVQAGEVQLTDVPPDQFNSFIDDEAFRPMELAGLLGWFLQFDLVTTPLFSDPRVRQAMYHAIDRQGIIEALFQGRAEERISMASPLSWIFNPNVPRFEFDVERANALLDEAGWMLGDDGVRTKDGDRIEFTLMTISRTNEWALAIQPFLADVGIRYEIEQVEFATWISRMVVGEYEGTIGGWSNGILDPRADLQTHFVSPRPEDATGYDNEQVNELFAQAQVAASREEEKPLYDEIQMIAEGTPVYVHLWRPLDLLVARADLILPEAQTVPELYARMLEWEVSG